MTEARERARRIVDAVLQAAPPPEIRKPDYLDEQLEPLRELLADVADGLTTRRAKASIGPMQRLAPVSGMVVDYDYDLTSNSGKAASIGIRGLIDMPGVVPRFVIHGLDEAAEEALKGLLADRTWIDVHPHITRAVSEVEAFLLRFLPS